MDATYTTTVHTKLMKLVVIISAVLMLTLLGSAWLPSSVRPNPSIAQPASHSNVAGYPNLGTPLSLPQTSLQVTNTQINGSTLSQTLTNNSTTAHIPFMGNYNCSDDICSQFLFESNVNWYCRRQHNINIKDIEMLERINGSCHFMNGSHRAPVGLISLPGSGNTWVRGLLEQATGICTGSVYCESSLREGGFIGEGFQSGVVLAVKDHNTPIVWNTNSQYQEGTGPPWGSVILLIRNPLDALVADFNRVMAKGNKQIKGSRHTASVSSEYFGTNETWGSFINSSLDVWTTYFVSLIQNGTRMNRPFLVIRYEDIKSDKLSEVKKMLNFLKVPVSDQLLEARMSMDYEKFHRTRTKEFEHYTPEQKQQVLAVVKEVINMLQEENNGTGNTFGIMDYMNENA